MRKALARRWLPIPERGLSVRIRRRCLGSAVLLVGCFGCQGGHLPAPVSERSPVLNPRVDQYRVAPGDTLYSVAFRYQLDFLDLARWNRLKVPYALRSGQSLQLSAPRVASGEPRPATRKPAPGAARTSPPPGAAAVRWRWPIGDGSRPTSSAVRRDFGALSIGMDLQLPAPGPIRAAGTGQVVYAGSGLGGYEHLIILRHGARYLSAYGFNGRPLVAEGAAVKVGGPLADTRSIGQRGAWVHFEIRDRGAPVDPKQVIR